METNLTIRLPDQIKSQLDKLAKLTGRSRAFHAQEALTRYLEEEAWQVQEIKQAVKEADAGDFAADVEVSRVMKKLGIDAG
jgi:RHH-type transcriptional regulator, rel operon repressor / antitoxin RelB